MPDIHSNPRAAILAWLDAHGHEDFCPTNLHAECCETGDEDCNCDLGMLNAAVRVVLERHRPVSFVKECLCGHFTSRGFCQTIHYLASALGVTTP